MAIAAESTLLRDYLTCLLGHSKIEAITALPLNVADLSVIITDEIDVLLVELDNNATELDPTLYDLLQHWKQPVLFTDSVKTKSSLEHSDCLEYGRELCEKLYSLSPNKKHVAC